MATTTSYVDIGAIQRIESGTEVIYHDYVDMGAVQRKEASGGFTPKIRRELTPYGTRIGSRQRISEWL